MFGEWGLIGDLAAVAANSSSARGSDGRALQKRAVGVLWRVHYEGQHGVSFCLVHAVTRVSGSSYGSQDGSAADDGRERHGHKHEHEHERKHAASLVSGSV